MLSDAMEEAEAHLFEREEAWQRERDALEREREQREEMEKERIANSQAEGARELSNAREAIKRFKKALVNANGENKKLQNEIKVAAGSVAEAKSAAADAVSLVESRSKKTDDTITDPTHIFSQSPATICLGCQAQSDRNTKRTDRRTYQKARDDNRGPPFQRNQSRRSHQWS